MGAKFRLADRQRVRRLLQAMPAAVDQEIVATYQRHAPAILARARSEVPVKTGRLRAALAWKIMPATKSRSAQFRLGLLTKAIQKRLFYAKFLEFGRGAYGKKGIASKRKGRYIGAISSTRYDFVRGRTARFMQQTLGRDLRDVLGKALRKIGGE